MSTVSEMLLRVRSAMKQHELECRLAGHEVKLGDHILYLNFPYEHEEYDTPDTLAGVGELFGIQGVRVGSRYIDKQPYHIYTFTRDQCHQMLAVLEYHESTPASSPETRSDNEQEEGSSQEGSRAEGTR